ncbi:hypothetical protein [Azospirillum largimobile]
MGLSITMAEMIVREHRFRPITGDVITIGRQTVFFDAETALRILKGCGMDISGLSTDSFELEDRTIQTGQGVGLITADSFFRALGVPKILSLDHSDYEGAEIVHDLTKPLPAHLEGVADVIFDGSTLDNVWDPALALKNLSRMLRPNGRLFSINMGSNHYGPYTILTAPWLYDYFVVNEFADVRVYMQVSEGTGPYNIFAVDPNQVGTEPMEHVRNLATQYQQGLYVLAEKGPSTTWDRTPIQQFYQGRDQRDAYRRCLKPFKESRRPDVLFSSAAQFTDCPEGYRLVTW